MCRWINWKDYYEDGSLGLGGILSYGTLVEKESRTGKEINSIRDTQMALDSKSLDKRTKTRDVDTRCFVVLHSRIFWGVLNS